MRLCWHSIASIEAPAIVAASGCAPPMPPRPAVSNPLVGEIAVAVLASCFRERLVRALDDSLRADVDPRARRHLAEHHQPLAVELVEVLPRRPFRHEVRVRDQHARRVHVRAEYAHRLARLDQQRLVVVQVAQRGDDRVEALPIACGAADAAVDDECLRILANFGIEIVHQHPQRRFGQPRLARALGPARRADRALGVARAGLRGPLLGIVAMHRLLLR